MVSYDCPYCSWGRDDDDCFVCKGVGSLRNGKPEGDVDYGITDPDPNWRKKWGKDYAKERAKGLWGL